MNDPVYSVADQRLYAAADDAYISEGGYLARRKDDAAILAPGLRLVVPIADRGMRASPAARANRRSVSSAMRSGGPSADERDLMARRGIIYTNGLYHFALMHFEQLRDALVCANAAKRGPSQSSVGD
jgi:hypothetical protein